MRLLKKYKNCHSEPIRFTQGKLREESTSSVLSNIRDSSPDPEPSGGSE